AFLADFSSRKSRLSNAVADWLVKYSWPGNVRELRNAMERAALLSLGELILPEHLPARVRPVEAESSTNTSRTTANESELEEVERQAICNALCKHDFNRTETAKALGISRRALIYKLQRYRE